MSYKLKKHGDFETIWWDWFEVNQGTETLLARFWDATLAQRLEHEIKQDEANDEND